MMPSGRVPEKPTELITSEAMARVLRDLEDVTDLVLIDLLPMPLVTDAPAVAAVTKNAILVIGPRASTMAAITSARQQLDRLVAWILGRVLNGPDTSLSQTYYSY
jgi:Mrp family chromosome partitioning ATPase